MAAAHKDSTVLCLADPVVNLYAFVSDEVLAKHNLEKGSTVVLSPEALEAVLKDVEVVFTCPAGMSNVARGMGFLGSDVSLFGQYADDEKGAMISAGLKEYNVKDHCLVKKGGRSTYNYILVSSDAKRVVLPVSGASREIDPDQVDYSIVGNFDYFFISAFQFCDEHLPSATRLVDEVLKRGVKLMFNLASVSCVTKFYDRIKPVVEATAVLSGNEKDFKKFYGLEDSEQLYAHLATLCTGTADSKFELVVVQLDSKGAVVFEHGKRFDFAPPELGEVVDLTGIGTFHLGGYLYGYFKGYHPEVSAKIGDVLAVDIISRLGLLLSEDARSKVRAIEAKL
ncbi:kinase, pfkB family member protein [Theileria equi strain WA]|uniref:Kinase, pfkB family member protein n=1 Tax=Theileria equi strain WA TaxID=1537102 RepID=L0AV98_THEEQ|nr:kinase, pfkB family member protein [Theileria equi strain WA]XP_004828597.1 kinase, pfkB family member protein [Theileria equi strain WA]AFZ78910.1 kinase, pfkB family member protein [Theileria equi strain WA]AFZ78931.1 kinase, pfkB family member protein [Theileria equi strain WA]|eukprot:XP_004828576.1 kinase, pfkB family member protein [Theileria equi strain WA]